MIVSREAPSPGAKVAAHAAGEPATGPNPARPRRLRVLVVDDSVVARRLVARILGEDPLFDVVGFAENGAIALSQAALLDPDVITLDIEMPVLDGLGALRELRARRSRAVVILCSSLTTRGAQSTIDALLLGANDYVTKVAGPGAGAADDLTVRLIAKIKQFFPAAGGVAGTGGAGTGAGARLPGLAQSPPARVQSAPGRALHVGASPPALAVRGRVEERAIVAIGVSTGGPTALLNLLPRLPAEFPVPIVIVQHMPPVFTGQLAARLNAESKLTVLEATEGLVLRPGLVVLAPGDFHMRLRRVQHEVVVTLDQGPRENSCRPSVDVLFRSVGEIYQGRGVALILTGMGQDGLHGVEDLKQRGAYVMVQDKQSSVVWGMPGAVSDAGLADAVLALEQIPASLERQVPRR